MKTPGGGALLRLLPIPQTYRSTQLKALFCTVHFAFQSVNYLNEIAESLLSGFEPGQMNVDCERGRPQGGALQFLDFMFASTPASPAQSLHQHQLSCSEGVVVALMACKSTIAMYLISIRAEKSWEK